MNFRAIPAIPGAASLKPSLRLPEAHPPRPNFRAIPGAASLKGAGEEDGGGEVVGVLEC